MDAQPEFEGDQQPDSVSVKAANTAIFEDKQPWSITPRINLHIVDIDMQHTFPLYASKCVKDST